MNIAIAGAMLRQQFQRTWPILASCLGISIVLGLIQYTVHVAKPVDVPFNSDFTVFTIVMVHVIGFLALLYCHSDERDLKMTMPTYLLRLPVRTIELVIWRMGYGLFCVAVIGIGSSGVHYLLFGAQMKVAFAFWTPLLVGIPTFAVLQALAWSIGARGIVSLLVGYVIVTMFAEPLGFDRRVTNFEPSPAGVVFFALFGSFLVAYVGVRTRRREGFDISRVLALLPFTFARDRGVDHPPFTSPEQAMRWLEWRRQSRLLPVLVCGVSISALVIFLRLNGMDMYQGYTNSAKLAANAELAGAICATMLGLTTATFGPYCLFQNQRLQLGPQKTFLFVRPVSTRSLASARLLVVLHSVMLSMVPLVVVCAVAVYLAAGSGSVSNPSQLPVFIDEHLGPRGVGIALLLFLGMFAITWCVHWFGNLLAMLAVLAVVNLLLLVIVGNDSSRMSGEFQLFATGIVSLAAVAFAFYVAHKRELLEKKILYVAIAVWPFLMVGFPLLLHWGEFVYDGGISWERLLSDVSIVVAYAALPLAPFATVPLLLDFARHR